MMAKKKGALGAAICLVAVLLSVFIHPTASRYVLQGIGSILQTVITSPPISVTFMDGTTQIHKDDSLSHGMKIISLKTSYTSYTTYSDDVGENTMSFTDKLLCPVCNVAIGEVNGGEYIGCSSCGVKVEGWMNATGNLPDEVTVLRNFVLNAKWDIPNKYHLNFIDVNGNIVIQKEFNGTNRSVTISSAEAERLNTWANEVGEDLTSEANNAVTVTANWKKYATAGTHTMPEAADVTVNLELAFGEGDASANIKLEPVVGADGKITDIDGDGFPDQFIVVGASQDDSNIDVTIPNSILGSPIVGIANNAFAGFDGLHVVTISKSVTSIGSDAFSDKSLGLFQGGETITFYYEGSYDDWTKITRTNKWDDGLGTGCRIFFLNGGDKVDSTQGYIQRTSSWGNFSWQYHSSLDSSFNGIYTGDCDCKVAGCPKTPRPDAKYWPAV